MKRRLMVILLSLTLIFTLMPATVFAVSDVTEPIRAESGDNLTVGNVAVENAYYAVSCKASSDSQDSDASVKVNGNVTIDAGQKDNLEAAVGAESKSGKATVDISGYVTGKANKNAEGIVSDAGSVVKVGSNVSISSYQYALGVLLYGSRDAADVDGNIQIGGNLSVTGGVAYGVFDSTKKGGQHKISVGKDITVSGTIEEEGAVADGIVLASEGGEGETIDVGGNITANSKSGVSYGIVVNSRSDTIEQGKSIVKIHGNVVSNVGIVSSLLSTAGRADIIVEGAIKADDTAVVLQKLPGDNNTKCFTKLTIWKANLNSKGNVAEIAEYGNPDERTAARDFEKSINYIIKNKQPSKGGKIYAVNSSGDALAKSYGYRVAKEGDKIIVKANLDSGWKLKSVYDNGKALKKDDNGNFYLTVHKGGGILLSADLEAPGSDPTQMGSDGTAVGAGASAAAAEDKITGMKTDTDPKGSKFNKLALRSTKQSKTTITLKWKSNKKAEKYVIYGNRCGTSTKIRKSVKLYTVKKSTKKTMTKVIRKVKGKSLKKNTYYKFLVVALNKKNEVVSTSRMIHVATKGGKYTNYKKISIKKSILTKAQNLKKGKTLKLEAKQIKVKDSLKARKHVAIRYESSNKTIAKVTSKGVIKALKKGTCYVYIYAQNGVYKKVRVIVK